MQAQLAQAQQLYSQQRYSESAAAFQAVLAAEPSCREALEYLVTLALQAGNPQSALQYLQQLVSVCPEEPLYCDRLALLYERQGMPEAASDCYQRLLARRPELVATRFNHAHLLRRSGQDSESLAQYQRCLRDGISDPQEVYSNIGSILTDLHRDTEAERAFTRALEQQPEYIPALYNFALLREEQGDWPAASALFRQVLALQPGHPEALVRLAQGQSTTELTDPLMAQIGRCLEDPATPAPARESLYYGQGKVLDDCGVFPRAFASYTRANQLSRERAGPYLREAQESLVNDLIARFSADRLAAMEPVSAAPLLFICGMFRSGSTLLEQMLAAHPALTAGGEINYFQQHAPLPGLLQSAQPAAWQALGAGYLRYLEDTFGQVTGVSNKRPDNFLYLGLIRGLFPNARIIHTVRQPLDNCLSVYFQQLGTGFNYANDLFDTGHYLLQHQRLMAHWSGCFGANVRGVNYADLVSRPRETLQPLLQFLQLDWDDACLDFHRLDNRVRTASVAQVRQPLYAHACDRWLNYQQELTGLRHYLASGRGPAPGE